MGGATQYVYQYDDLYRLIHAKGTFDYEPNKQHRYQLEITYDTIHNITAKTQQHEVREPSGVLIEQHKTTYDWQYPYAGPQPHAPTHIGERAFGYDADGNQAGWEHDRNGTRRTIVWDEESRVQSIADNGHTMTYKYNAANQRVIKRGPQGETVYVSPFFTIRNREVGTKHVYANGVRLVSKLMQQDKPGANPRGKIPEEKDIYFYHPDHLGTSMYVTDAKGELYEHLEYFPFGETFVEESSNTQRTPYLFTAKELDEETQLYYFGARYFDPQTSVWQSPDPLMTEYLPIVGVAGGLSGMGGVFNSRNLQLYGYAGQNPVTYIDLEGLSFRARARRAGRGVAGWLSSRKRMAGDDEPSFSISIPFLTLEYFGKAGPPPPRGEKKLSSRRWRWTTFIGEFKDIVGFPKQLLASKETRVWYYRRTPLEFSRQGRSYRWEGWIIHKLP
jgi:RHS repeat-associated protein